MGQFHQLFTNGFFVQKFRAKLFVLEVQVKNFLAEGYLRKCPNKI
jgi:hypothetical protein